MSEAAGAAEILEHSIGGATIMTADAKMLVTMRVNGQLFGVPVQHVRDVLREQKMTKVPLAPKEIAGSINLRGRIVTVINVRARLRLPEKSDGERQMFVVVERHNELYSLMVDDVGDVMNIPHTQIEKTPANMGSGWKEVASGIHRLDDELLVVIDPEILLTLNETSNESSSV